MFHFFNRTTLYSAALLACWVITASTDHAQQSSPAQPVASPDDVVRINTQLVQTEVMVFDRQGRLVAGIQPDHFELKLNGVHQPVNFFEYVTSGSAAEAAQLEASLKTNLASKTTSVTRNSDLGRVIFFFVDDLHLSVSSLSRTRHVLQEFVGNSMNTTDRVAIVSSSGQIGFLQQLTDNPTVLNAAIARLHYKQDPEANTGKTQISDYMASQVLDYGNRELYAYLLESVKVEQQMGPGSRHGDHGLAASYSAQPYLRNRLRQINAQGRITTTDTLSALESLMESSAALPGRKLAFFLSDGFIINERKSGALEALERLTRTAARSGVVVYTLDMRGVFSNFGSAVDASTNSYADASARRAGLALGEVAATQSPLKLIAEETGGRAIVNTNALSEGIRNGIRETAEYYLLAWRPESLYSPEQKLRVEVTVKDRPDLQVRLRSNLYNTAVPAPSNTTARDEKKGATSEPGEIALLSALGALYQDKHLPLSISAGYVKSDAADLTLRVSMQLDRQSLDLDPTAKHQKTQVDVMGVAIDDRGQFASFKQLISVPPESSHNEPRISWTQQLTLKPGLYQVRVAVRERSGGRTGNAMQWIELPDLGKTSFGLSSLFLGERKPVMSADNTASPQPVSVSITGRFPRSSVLRFQTYVYNATRGANGPEVTIKAQVFRDRQLVVTLPDARVPVTSEGSRLPYWSEIGLDTLPAGQYYLQVTATDQLTKQASLQRINFRVE